MDKKRVKRATKLLEQGRSMAQVAGDCYVHVSTLRKWVRNYERYGDSLWTNRPEELDRE